MTPFIRFLFSQLRSHSILLGLAIGVDVALCRASAAAPPVLTGLTNLTIAEDSRTTVSFSVKATNVDLSVATNFTLNASSSNTNVVNSTGLSFGGANTNRTLLIAPRTNAFGTTTITVVAGAGGLYATNAFTLMVTNVNDPPSFVMATNRLDALEDVGTVVFANFLTGVSAGPNETNQGVAFTLSAVTTNRSNFAFKTAPALTGAGTSRTLTYAPAADAFGTNSVTIVMNDLGLSPANYFTNSFTIAIASVDDPPTIRELKPTFQMSEDTTATNNFVVADIDSPITNVTVTATASATNLLGAHGLTVNGTATNRVTLAATNVFLVLRPLANAYGSNIITVVATSGALSTTNAFTLVVNDVNDPPSFRMATNRLVGLESSSAVVVGNFLTEVSAGPNESYQTVAFALLSTTTNAGNFAFKSAPALTGSGGSRNLTYTPAASAFGTNVVTIIMSDAGLNPTNYFTNSFVIALGNVDTAPVIRELKAQLTMREDTVATNSFVVVDIDSPITAATVTATASGSNLFGPHGLSVNGALTSGATLTSTNVFLVLQPQPNAFGTNTITVVAHSGGLTATNSFLVIVTDVNDPPSFRMATNKIVSAEDSGAVVVTNFLTEVSAGPNETDQTVAFTLATPTTNASNFSFKSGPTLTGTGSARTLNYTPAANSFGTNLVTIILNDSGVSPTDYFTNYFTIVVTNVDDPPSIRELKSAFGMLEDTVATNHFVVTDIDSPISNVTVTATSSGGGLFGFNSVTVNGITTNQATLAGTNVFVVLHPRADAFGSNTITIVASSGGLSVTNAFTLIVTNVNDAPRFSVPSTNVTAIAGLAKNVTNFVAGISAGPNEKQTVSFTNVSVSSPSLFIVPPTIKVSGNSGTLNFTPALNASGTSVIGIRAIDDGAGSVGGTNFSAIVYYQITIGKGSLASLPSVAMAVEPPKIDSLNVNAAGAVTLQINNPASLPYRVEFSSDMIHWQPLSGGESAPPLFQATDHSAFPILGARFYRVVIDPAPAQALDAQGVLGK